MDEDTLIIVLKCINQRIHALREQARKGDIGLNDFIAREYELTKLKENLTFVLQAGTGYT